MHGTLYVVATPIGNLSDWSPRARRVIAEADLVLVEDTRVSRKLFSAFDLHPKPRVFEKFREQRVEAAVLGELKAGKTVALISDAGTPAIADPGSALVAAALANGIGVSPIPGPSVLAAALSVAGVTGMPLTFHGYLPHKAGRRLESVLAWKGDTTAHVVLLPPHDAAATLELLATHLPTRHLVLCRELTKVHEQVLAGTAAEIGRRLAKDDAFRGEMTLVIHGAAAETAAMELDQLLAEARRLSENHKLRGRELSDFLAFKTGVPRRTAYRVVEKLKDS